MNLVKFTLFIIISGFLVACATTKESIYDDYTDLVEVNPPERIPYVEKELYIDSIEPVQIGKNTAFVIKGSFPNACTQILRLDEDFQFEVLHLTLIGWQKYEQTCAEVITPFTIIYENITNEQLEELTHIRVNDELVLELETVGL